MPPIILKGKPDRERLEALLTVLRMHFATPRPLGEMVPIRIQYGGLEGMIGALEAALHDMEEAGH